MRNVIASCIGIVCLAIPSASGLAQQTQQASAGSVAPHFVGVWDFAANLRGDIAYGTIEVTASGQCRNKLGNGTFESFVPCTMSPNGDLLFQTKNSKGHPMLMTIHKSLTSGTAVVTVDRQRYDMSLTQFRKQK